ncbi:FAD-dependent oxidoreductase [Patescibacteria group bacterium]|nr:FAD-dependent oxidoreductase [Patescibacteria group bacterium]
MYDAIIVGGGPAGLAAAVYFARQQLKFVILTGTVGGQTLWSSDVEDYLGFHLLDGQSLVKRFTEHLADYKDQFEIKEGSLVTGVEKVGQDFRVTTARESYEARAILIATGTHHRELGVPGEKEYFNKGVTYCATCDAPLFKGKNVFVIGGGNSAMDAALFAEKYASAVTVVSVNPELAGDAVMKAGIEKSKTIRVLTSTKTTKIVGEQFVTGIGLVGADGVERVESCEGVFIEIGLVPVSEFIHIVKKDKRQQIMVDRQNRTSEPGIYAAGDVTDVSQKQIAVAVGEGSKAALELISYLQHRV